ncbi:hypothetical protein OSTOST_22418, partial [Ostertagia ostertagi]
QFVDSSTSEDSLDSVSTTIRLQPSGYASEGNTLDRTERHEQQGKGEDQFDVVIPLENEGLTSGEKIKKYDENQKTRISSCSVTSPLATYPKEA